MLYNKFHQIVGGNTMSKIKNIKIYSAKILTPKKILILSDIHFGHKTFYSLNLLKEKLLKSSFKPDFIILAGDIIDSLNEIESIENQDRLRDFLTSLTKNIKTFAIIGNHDQMTRTGFDSWLPSDITKYLDILSSIPNLSILQNNIKQNFQEIEIGGFTPSIDYYLQAYESKEVYKKEYEEFGSQLNFSPDKFSIFVSHDPISLITLSQQMQKCLNPNTDLTISGHTHNGLAPSFLQPFFKNHGFVSPSLKHNLFPAYAYGKIISNNTTYLINGAVNNFSEITFFNKIYGINFTNLELLPSKDNQILSKKK